MSDAAEPDQRGPAIGGDAQLARDRADVDVVAAESEQLLHPHRVRRRRGRQPRHDAGRQHRAAAQDVLDVVGQRRRPLLQPDRAGEAGSAARVVDGRWMPTASRGRSPNSGRSATRTTSPLARSASKMPHWPIHSRCSGGPARPRIVRRRSSSASSLDAEYASTWDCSSSMLIMPRVRSAMDCASPNRSVPES